MMSSDYNKLDRPLGHFVEDAFSRNEIKQAAEKYLRILDGGIDILREIRKRAHVILMKHLNGEQITIENVMTLDELINSYANGVGGGIMTLGNIVGLAYGFLLTHERPPTDPNTNPGASDELKA